jgi:signal transduction histidine kinase
MTLGFVLVLAPFLLVTCLVLVLVSTRLDTVRTQALLRQTVTQARRVLSRPDPDWRDGLADLMARPALREHEVGLLVLDGRRVVWRSSDGLPTRPVAAGGAWQVAVRKAGPLTVFALHPSPERTARRDHLLWELLILCLCVTIGAAAGAWALVGWTLRPIHQLSRQSDAAAADGLDVQLNAPSQDAEVVELVGTLNGLLARQARAAAAKGRFYAAASHELRTPLQALSGHLELALSRPRRPEEYKAALDEAQGQARRLTALVRALLLLHQLEGPGRPPQEPTDLTAVCDNALALIGPLLVERGLRLTAEIAEGAGILAAPTHAEMLVRNLLENASRHATAEGHVSVKLTRPPGGAHLKVSNECTLPDAEDPQTWLEPFHRPDHARAADTGGNGLGLAICRALADANGWQIGLKRTPEGIVAEVVFSSDL